MNEFELKIKTKSIEKTHYLLSDDVVKRIKESNKEIRDSKKKKELRESEYFSSQLRELNKILNLSECNIKNKSKFIINKFHDNFQGSDITYNSYTNYSCGSASCNKCKSSKLFSYVSDRFLNTKDTYFITISTPQEYKNVSPSDIKNFKSTISNFFDFLQTPYISTFEFGEKGNKLHSHVVMFSPRHRVKYITDYFKLYSGYYTNGQIIKNSNDKINKYISKINKYISKINKDKDNLATENYLDISENIYNTLINIDKKTVNKIKNIKFKNKTYDKFFEYMNTIQNNIDNLDFFNVDEIKEREAFYILLSLSTLNLRKKFKKVINDLHENNDNIDEHLEKKKKYLRRFIKGQETYMQYYLKLIKFFNKETLKVEKLENGKIRIYSSLVFTSKLKKRVSSNISIISKHQKTYLEDDTMIEFFVNTQKQNIKKGIDLNNLKIDLEVEKYTTIDYFINNRVDRIESIIYNNVVKNSLLKKNKNINFLNSNLKLILSKSIKSYALNKAKKHLNLDIKNHGYSIKTISEENKNKILIKRINKIENDLKEIYINYYTDKKTIINQLPL